MGNLQLNIRKICILNPGKQRRLRLVNLCLHGDEGLHHVIAVSPLEYPRYGHAFIAFRAFGRLEHHLVVFIHGNAHFIANHNALNCKLHPHRARLERAAARI